MMKMVNQLLQSSDQVKKGLLHNSRMNVVSMPPMRKIMLGCDLVSSLSERKDGVALSMSRTSSMKKMGGLFCVMAMAQSDETQERSFILEVARKGMRGGTVNS